MIVVVVVKEEVVAGMGWADALSSLPCVLLLTLGVGSFQLKVYIE